MSGKRIFFALILIVVAAFAGLSGAVVGGVAVYSAVQRQAPSQPTTADTQPVIQSVEPAQVSQIVVSDISTPVTNAVESVGPAVVTVVATLPGQMTFFGRTADQPVSGSGVIISEQGYILTNNHVIEDTTEISVVLADGNELPAQLVGRDAFADLAVLKVDGKMPAVAPLGNSDTLKPGETVIAIGSPLGDFKNSVTVGVVSATGRSLDVNENYQMEGLIQTDAAINEGNSGGPLVNLAGEVIGVNTLIVRGSGYGSAVAEGLGFAIPANTVQAISQQLIEKGYVSYPYLGIRWQWITPSIAYRYGLPVEAGAYVSYVDTGSPAAQAGLEEGDIITKIGESSLDQDHPFINVLYSFASGETVSLEFVRGQTTQTTQVTFGEHATP